MGKTKFRTINAFRGRPRKRLKKSRNENEAKSVVVSEEIIEESAETIAGENQIQSEQLMSATAMKFNHLGLTLEETNNLPKYPERGKGSDSFLIVQKACILKLVAKLSCPECMSSGLKFEADSDKSLGFSQKYSENCNTDVISDQFLCNRVNDSESYRTPFEVNMRATVAFRGIGFRHSALQEWCSLMYMPNCLSKQAFQNMQDKVLEGNQSTFQEVLKMSVEDIK